MDSPPPGDTNPKPPVPAAAVRPVPPMPPVRPYPKPPALLPRMVLLILKPEAWPAAARYPSRFTFLPLAIIIVLSAIAVGISYGVRFTGSVHSFANRFPPMEISSDGVLTPKAPLAEPVRYNFYNLHVAVDPNKTLTEDSVRSLGMFSYQITDRAISSGMNTTAMPLTELPRYGFELPAKGTTGVVDGAALHQAAPALGFMACFVGGFFQLVIDIVWSVLIMFFLVPLITLAASIGERSLILPKRAAYRMAAALIIPLIAFNAVMNVAGYPISVAIGEQMIWLFWFFAAAGLAVWTGIMARKMYGPTRKKVTRQS